MATTQEIIKELEVGRLKELASSLDYASCTIKNQEKELEELKAATKEMSTRLLRATEEITNVHNETVQFRERAQVTEHSIQRNSAILSELSTHLLHVTEELKASERRNANTRVHMERLIAEQENNLHNLISCFTCK